MDKDVAVLCARLAHIAYGRGRNEGAFTLLGRFSNAGTDTQGIFGRAFDDTFVVAFRGSEETGINDWITDLKFIPKTYPYSNNRKMRVHAGFFEAYASIRDAIQDQVKNSPYKKVISTGHSLGAALTTLFALDIKSNMPDRDLSCYTFGSPKVGNDDFAEAYDKLIPNTFRFVNGNDLIPAIPPGRYVHVGKEMRLGQADRDLQNIADNVLDHLPANYIRSLQDYRA